MLITYLLSFSINDNCSINSLWSQWNLTYQQMSTAQFPNLHHHGRGVNLTGFSNIIKAPQGFIERNKTTPALFTVKKVTGVLDVDLEINLRPEHQSTGDSVVIQPS
jgi:hypothetical protein